MVDIEKDVIVPQPCEHLLETCLTDTLYSDNPLTAGEVHANPEALAFISALHGCSHLHLMSAFRAIPWRRSAKQKIINALPDLRLRNIVHQGEFNERNTNALKHILQEVTILTETCPCAL